jgi:hypothetical protein
MRRNFLKRREPRNRPAGHVVTAVKHKPARRGRLCPYFRPPDATGRREGWRPATRRAWSLPNLHFRRARSACDAVPSARAFNASRFWCAVSFDGRPMWTPRSFARLRPSPVRARINSLSNSARARRRSVRRLPPAVIYDPTSLSQSCNSFVQNSNPPTCSGLTPSPLRLVASNVNFDPSSSSIG